MVYLIGGPPRCGKTTLGDALAKRMSVPYFTLDHVTSVISPYIPEQDYKTKLPLSIARQETNFSNDIFYSRYTPDQVVQFYLRQAETYWPGVESFIRYAISDDHNLILEGWQILPRLLRAVVTRNNQLQTKAIFLYKLDEGSIVAGLKKRTATQDWVLNNTKEENTFNAIAKMISQLGEYVEREARVCGFRSLNMDGEFTPKIREALDLAAARDFNE